MPRSQYDRNARVAAAFVITECTKLAEKPPRPSHGLIPSSFHAPHSPTCTGCSGSLTSKMRKSGLPGVVARCVWKS